MKKKIGQVKTLLDVLPYIKLHQGKTIVIKYGGIAQTNQLLKETFAQDILLLYLLGIHIVIVHGDGKVDDTLKSLQLETRFVNGVRYIDESILEVIEMVLSGTINKSITSLLNSNGAKALGISGKDAHFIKAHVKDFNKFGLIGEINTIDTKVINHLLNDNFIPVISPIAVSTDSKNGSYALCSNHVACEVAKSLNASKLIYFSNEDAFYDEQNNEISTFDEHYFKTTKLEERLSFNMNIKVKHGFDALSNGVEKIHIINGKVEHALLLELFTSDGIGTVIKEHV